jgi:hypothetical protein
LITFHGNRLLKGRNSHERIATPHKTGTRLAMTATINPA